MTDNFKFATGLEVFGRLFKVKEPVFGRHLDEANERHEAVFATSTFKNCSVLKVVWILLAKLFRVKEPV